MHEFLLWANCNNNCKFCWQKKIADPRCQLTLEQKEEAIYQAIDRIKAISDHGDVLIVGGEVFNAKEISVRFALNSLFETIATRVRKDELRFFYLNTNLLYADLTILYDIYEIFDGIHDRIKFTTSYDIEGRFAKEGDEQLFLDNLRRLREDCPEFNIVVNSIMTKEFCDLYLADGPVGNRYFKEKYGVRYVNMLPYIPIDGNCTPFGKVICCLEKAEKDEPGFIERYVKDYDYNQDKILWEYHNDTNEFVECTSKYAPCGHNANFAKAMKHGRCFICELKNYLNERA